MDTLASRAYPVDRGAAWTRPALPSAVQRSGCDEGLAGRHGRCRVVSMPKGKGRVITSKAQWRFLFASGVVPQSKAKEMAHHSRSFKALPGGKGSHSRRKSGGRRRRR